MSKIKWNVGEEGVGIWWGSFYISGAQSLLYNIRNIHSFLKFLLINTGENKL